jgi:hypothetical protein
VPRRQRHSEDFKEKEHELMRKLNLVGEFWTMNSALNRSAESCWPEGYIARTDWLTCHRVRDELLAACAEQNPAENSGIG